MTADAKGFVQNAYGPDREPVLLDGKQLVLPYSEQLRNFNPDEKIIFHPMAENIFKGESEVIKLLKRKIMVKANITAGFVLQALINILASPGLHNQMNPQQAELFNFGIEADEKTLVNFIKIMKAVLTAKEDRGYVSAYINRGASYEGKRCTRVNVVSFPLFEQLTKEKETPNGIPIDHLRVKDRECLVKLHAFMFPDLGTPETYNYGTNNNMVPYLDALLMGSAKITSRLNDLVETYKDYIDSYQNCIFSTEWFEDMQNVDMLKSEVLRIPVQHGNDGSLMPQAEAQPAQVQQPVAAPSQMSPVAMPQSRQPVAAPTTNGKVSFGDAVQANGIANQMQAAMYAQQPMMPYGSYPQQPMQPQMVPQGYPMQQPMMPQGYHQQPMQQPMMPNGYPMQQPMMPQAYPQQPMQPQPYQQQQPLNGWPEPFVSGYPMRY
jgi:hypothetical protein